MAADKTSGVIAEYSAEYTEWQRQLAREKLDRDRMEAEHVTRQENAGVLAASAKRQVLLDRCKPVVVYTRMDFFGNPFGTVATCIEMLIEASGAFRRANAGTDSGCDFNPDAVRSEYEKRLLAMLEAGLIGLVEPATMLPWSGNPEWSNVHNLLLAREDLVLFAKYQGIEVGSSETELASGSTSLDDVGEKSWPFVYATMAALAYLSGLKPHKVVNSVVAVLEKSKYPVNESTVRKYFEQIKSRGIVPQGEVPAQNFNKRPIRGGTDDAGA